MTGLQQICQLRISKVGPLSLLQGVTSGCCLQEKKGCQFPLSRRLQRPASLAACEQEWTLYVRHVWTCSGSRAGHQNKKTAWCVHTSTRFAPRVVTKKAEQNWPKCSFHFCYSEGKKTKTKTCHSQKLCPQFFLSIFKAERSILLVFTDSSSYTFTNKRNFEDLHQSTKYIQTAVTKFYRNNFIFRVAGVASPCKFRKY